MIKASELRIGNWVSSGVFYYQILPSQIEGVFNYPNSVLPIPLTPEILEKCGFELNKERTKWRRGHIELLVNFNGYDYFFGGFSKIQHLHQLQNLYFALTGEELQINLQ